MLGENQNIQLIYLWRRELTLGIKPLFSISQRENRHATTHAELSVMVVKIISENLSRQLVSLIFL